jgi:hypothetical protein
MADEALKTRIRTALEKAYFNQPGDRVSVFDGTGDNVHLMIVSSQFRDPGDAAKRDLIWGVLVHNLDPKDWGKITLSTGVTPEEAAGMTEEELMAL